MITFEQVLALVDEMLSIQASYETAGADEARQLDDEMANAKNKLRALFGVDLEGKDV